jgi:hypothetical protein
VASNPTTMASFMAVARNDNPKLPGEPDDDYRQRLYEIARPAFEAYMASTHANLMLLRHGEQADTRDRLARERDGFDFNQTVRELKQTVLPLPGEDPTKFHSRVAAMARQLETASYGGAVEQGRAREAAKRAAREARLEQLEREQARPLNQQTVHRERMSQSQTCF